MQLTRAQSRPILSPKPLIKSDLSRNPIPSSFTSLTLNKGTG